MAVKQITLRAWSDNSNIPPQTINQGDILSRTVLFTLHDSGGTPIDLTQSTVRVHFSKPDGKVCYLTASIVNAAAGMITVTLDSQCTAVPGTVKTIVQVTSPNGENLYIIGPVFAVGEINIEGSIVSANEFTTLTDALKEVKDIANEFTALKDELKHENKADKSTKINGHPLTGSFDISAAEIGALSRVKILSAGHVANALETQVVDLGFKPKYVRIRAEFGINNGANYDSDGVSDGASQCCFFKFGNAVAAPSVNEYNIVAIHSGSGGNYAKITFTDTGYTLVWAQTGIVLPTGTIMMLVTVLG